MLCQCHPWQLDSGDPCRNDGSGTCGNINSSYDQPGRVRNAHHLTSYDQPGSQVGCAMRTI